MVAFVKELFSFILKPEQSLDLIPFVRICPSYSCCQHIYALQAFHVMTWVNLMASSDANSDISYVHYENNPVAVKLISNYGRGKYIYVGFKLKCSISPPAKSCG